MAVADSKGNPIAISVESGEKGEAPLVPKTIDGLFTTERPAFLIGDKAYDSGILYRQMHELGIHLVAPHQGLHTLHFQDGRCLRRVKRRYKVERLFAWMKKYRRLRIRWETKVENFTGFVLLACMLILLRNYL